MSLGLIIPLIVWLANTVAQFALRTISASDAYLTSSMFLVAQFAVLYWRAINDGRVHQARSGERKGGENDHH